MCVGRVHGRVCGGLSPVWISEHAHAHFELHTFPSLMSFNCVVYYTVPGLPLPQHSGGVMCTCMHVIIYVLNLSIMKSGI